MFFSSQANAGQWHVVFLVTAAVYFASNLVFLIFGKAEVQPWNSPTYEKEKAKKSVIP